MDFTKFKAAIFDLDGTLIESSHVWSEIDEDFLGRRGIKVPEDYFKAVSVMNFSEAALYTKQRFGLEESTEDMMKEWQEMAVYRYANEIGLVKGADSFLRYLHENGVKIALATASSAELYEPVLKRHGLYELFGFFASTSQVKRGKGYPDVYEFACGGLGEKPENSIVFEDIIEGVRGAKLGGFSAAACLNAHYIADRQSMIDEADCCFEDYHSLMEDTTHGSEDHKV